MGAVAQGESGTDAVGFIQVIPQLHLLSAL